MQKSNQQLPSNAEQQFISFNKSLSLISFVHIVEKPQSNWVQIWHILDTYIVSPEETTFLQSQSGTIFSKISICSSASLISTKSKQFIIIFCKSYSFVIEVLLTEPNIESITLTSSTNDEGLLSNALKECWSTLIFWKEWPRFSSTVFVYPSSMFYSQSSTCFSPNMFIISKAPLSRGGETE